jgi:hypothetical protein
MNRYDLVFMGHVTIDEIEAKEGSAHGVPGGAPYFGAIWGNQSVYPVCARSDPGLYTTGNRFFSLFL